jgi:hypothetical protein
MSLPQSSFIWPAARLSPGGPLAGQPELKSFTGRRRITPHTLNLLGSLRQLATSTPIVLQRTWENVSQRDNFASRQRTSFSPGPGALLCDARLIAARLYAICESRD